MLVINITGYPSTIKIGENKKQKISYFSYLNSHIKYGTDDGEKILALPEAYVVYKDGRLRWSKQFLTVTK
jgi:hypothetical protein